ncbi:MULTISPECIES: c-type cytochrome [unclassified Devosia]|uniref:c-type cytochrome n=1 Tax=unclassified Devosia TaxID=196773 RepID=UPI00145F23D9|nr:c-type cytochrome [Devosia sp. MC521]MBJ6987400.1 c-type cytochrome [Devosia sp. MC521]MBK1794201.1 c-type cytochrome [Devosia sp. WQ 349K1]QMW63569.1 c-type cytochrome [Devosia sp. MC521]
MTRTSKRLTAAMVAFTAFAGVANAAGFTAEQAAAGKIVYDQQCAACHGRQLEGPDAPGLFGMDVMQNWDSAGGLYDFIAVAMPPSGAGTLGDEAYLNIVAYIMEFNGAEPGDEPMVADEDLLYAISLQAEVEAGLANRPAAAASEVAAPATGPAVPQAYTWGKQLPGGAEPAAPAAPAAPSVPQAFTFGKTLPVAN